MMNSILMEDIELILHDFSRALLQKTGSCHISRNNVFFFLLILFAQFKFSFTPLINLPLSFLSSFTFCFTFGFFKLLSSSMVILCH